MLAKVLTKQNCPYLLQFAQNKEYEALFGNKMYTLHIISSNVTINTKNITNLHIHKSWILH